MRNISSLIAICALAIPAMAQNQQTICFESFDYAPGSLGTLSGGSGWSNDWWSGNNFDDGLVVTPGFDPVGNRMTTNLDHGGSYRLLDMANLGSLLDQGAIGADGNIVWLQFDCQRTSDDEYGGLILNWQWNQEGLFVGSPYAFYEWGLEQPWQSPPQWVLGSNCDVQAHLTTRIEFLPGDERIMLWIDPPVTNPDPVLYPPDLETWVLDFRFNEIGLKSGHGADPLDTGFDFDTIEITADSWQPSYAVTNAIAGQTANFDIANMGPGNTCFIGYSLTGAGPTQTMFGDAAMTPPILQLPQQTVDPNGEVHFTMPMPANAAGLTVYTQAAEMTGVGSGQLSNPVTVTVQ